MTLIDPFAPPADIRVRIERLVRGESLAAAAVAQTAGTIPSYYGALTTAEISQRWLMLAQTCSPIDREFYLAGAVGWASRD